MQRHVLWDKNLYGYFRRNGAGFAVYFALYLLGGCFGYSLCRSLYGEMLASLPAEAFQPSGRLPLYSILLFAVLPAFMYCCCMLFCACERHALPIWGAAQLLAGVRCGLSVCVLTAISLLWAFPICLVCFCGQTSLAILSLDSRRQGAVPDIYRLTDRFLIPSTAYLATVSLSQLMLTLGVQRALFR